MTLTPLAWLAILGVVALGAWLYYQSTTSTSTVIPVTGPSGAAVPGDTGQPTSPWTGSWKTNAPKDTPAPWVGTAPGVAPPPMHKLATSVKVTPIRPDKIADKAITPNAFLPPTQRLLPRKV